MGGFGWGPIVYVAKVDVLFPSPIGDFPRRRMSPGMLALHSGMLPLLDVF